jgi:hypothetical protein
VLARLAPGDHIGASGKDLRVMDSPVSCRLDAPGLTMRIGPLARLAPIRPRIALA